MAGLLVFKEKLRTFYRKYEKFVKPIGRFLIAFLVLFIINARVPFFPLLNNILVTLGVSLVCAFLELKYTVVFAGIELILNIYKASMELAFVVALLYIIMFLFYFRFTKREAIVFILLPIAFVLKIPYCIPIIMGLMGGMLSAVPVSFGILLCYMTEFVGTNVAALSKAKSLTTIEKFSFISQRIVIRPEIFITILAFCVTVIVVHLLRRASFNYAWLTSVVAGALVNTVIMLLGYFVINDFSNLLFLGIGELVSCGIGILVQFMYFPLDYSRVEKAQFEDDEYYYYVKAVPKMSVAAPEVTIKRFTGTEPVPEGVTPEEIVAEGVGEIKDENFLDEFEEEFIKDFVDKKRPIR